MGFVFRDIPVTSFIKDSKQRRSVVFVFGAVSGRNENCLDYTPCRNFCNFFLKRQDQ